MTLLPLIPLLIVETALAGGFANFTNQTNSRMVSDPSVGIADVEEKRWTSIGFMIMLFIATAIIAKSWKIKIFYLVTTIQYLATSKFFYHLNLLLHCRFFYSEIY